MPYTSSVLSLSRAVAGFATYLADERRFSERTVTAYLSDLERFMAFWESEFGEGLAAKTPLAKVDTLAVRSHLASLHRANLGNRSIARHCETVVCGGN